jgi:hypothetical protein
LWQFLESITYVFSMFRAPLSARGGPLLFRPANIEISEILRVHPPIFLSGLAVALVFATIRSGKA